MVEIGGLYALTESGEVDSLVPVLRIRHGVNVLGRNDCSLFGKKVSRKHVSIYASPNGALEITVEGPNSIVILSGAHKKKILPKSTGSLKDGDVVEFVPKELPFKYVAKIPGVHSNFITMSTSLSHSLVEFGTELIANGLSKEDEQLKNSKHQGNSFAHPVVHSNCTLVATSLSQKSIELCPELTSEFFIKENEVLKNRKHQVDEDEAFARLLQEEEDRAAADGFRSSDLSQSHEGSDSFASLKSAWPDGERKRLKSERSKVGNPSTFRLMHTVGLPHWVNENCVRIEDVIQGDMQLAILSNYMVDVTWLLSVCPVLNRVQQVVVIHGETGPSLELLQVSKPRNWILFKPPLRLGYGTHHSKAMILVYPTGVRIVVHTANLIHVDWNNKTQGLWMQDFPLKDQGHPETSNFEDDLVEYLEALEWPGCSVHFPQHGEMRVNSRFFRRFNYSSASVRLIASVPGYHRGRSMTKWGHMKLRTILHEETFEDHFQGSSLVYQFSSLGSLDEKWINEFTTSMSVGFTTGRRPLGLGRVQIVWPTVDDIRTSLEGYAAGSSVPSPQKNVQKEFLKKYWARWNAKHTGRSRAIPHIKTYVRYHEQSLAWFVLTSSNLSKAAWGALQKNGTQIMIRSYELGVCFLPSLVLRSAGQPFSCTDSASMADWSLSRNVPPKMRNELHVKLTVSNPKKDSQQQSSEATVSLPVPYSLPPPPYVQEDVPWSWDCQYRQPDVLGKCWPQ